MTNPYLTPKAELMSGDTILKSLGWKFWLVSMVTTVLSVLLGVMGTFVVPQFAVLFTQFGSDLPAITLFVIENRNYLWLASLCTITIWFYLVKSGFTRNRRTQSPSRLFLLLGVADVIMFVGVVYALYSPIFVMSEAVQ